MKAVVGILVIFIGFFIEYSVFTGKIGQGGITPPISAPPLPTAQSTSSDFQATTGQGTSSGYGTYQPPPVAGGYKPS